MTPDTYAAVNRWIGVGKGLCELAAWVGFARLVWAIRPGLVWVVQKLMEDGAK